MTGPEVSVIIPTYCEAASIRPLLQSVSSLLGLPGEIIVVDDGSPDGTAAIAREMTGLPCEVRVIDRQGRRDLSKAVVTGLCEGRGRVLVVMDADGSHPPEAITQLTRRIMNNGADLAIGSRYASGAETASDWPPSRRIVSSIATALARPLVSVQDPMSGFFAISSAHLARTAPYPTGRLQDRSGTISS